MKDIAIAYYNSPFGELILGSYEDALCLADWRERKARATIDKRLQSGLRAKYVVQYTPVLREAKEALDAYFEGRSDSFGLPLLFVGTEFQKSVWECLSDIKHGKTASYLSVANAINHPKAVRAVASAVGANALSIFVPCHRIIASDGTLGGYAGGLEAKKGLLELELRYI